MTIGNLPRRRRPAIWIVGIVIVLALLWCGYWYAAATLGNRALDRATAMLGARGATIACDRFGGFPLRLDLKCGQSSFNDAARGISAGVDGASLTAPLYWPGAVAVNLASPFVVDAPSEGLALTASWSSALLTAEAGLSGLNRAGGSVDGLDVARGDDSPRLPFVHLGLAHGDFAAVPAGGGNYQLTALAKELALVLKKERTLPPIDADMQFTALGLGSSLGKNPQATIKAWLTGGGTLQVDRLKLASGAFSAAASGALSLSADGLVSGTLAVRLVGLDALPAIVETIHHGAGDKVATVIGAIGMVARPVQEDGKPAVQVPLTFRNGLVSVGLIPLGRVPPVRF